MADITIGGNPTHTIGSLPAVGSKAPAFELANTKLEPVKLTDFEGKRLILNIVPSVDTGVCSLSAKTFERRAGEADNAVILVASKDLPFRFRTYAETEGVTHIQMASGYRSSFGEDYGVTLVDGPFETLFSRAVVVIDTDGTVLYTEQVAEISDEPNYDAALAALG